MSPRSKAVCLPVLSLVLAGACGSNGAAPEMSTVGGASAGGSSSVTQGGTANANSGTGGALTARGGAGSGGTGAAGSGSAGQPQMVTCDSSGQTEPAQVPLNFTPSDEDFLNPERGFHEDFPLPADSIGDVRGSGFSLLRSYVILSDFRTGPISSDFLNQLRSSLGKVRDAGIKVVLRFAYNLDGTEDAPDGSVLQHIGQLKPILQDNADIIALVQAGFIGQWGEWHDSQHGLNTLDNRKQILQALLDAVPSSLMVQMRYPWQRKQIFQTPLTDSTAFSGMGAARVGHHNDCFVTNDNDEGTYGSFTDNPSGNPSSSDIENWKSYTAAESRYVAVGGETCANLDRSACSTAKSELARFHYSYLNAHYEPTVNARWQSEGCMAEIRKRLGYRFALQNGSISGHVAPGGLLHVVFSVQNNGYAVPYNARPMYLVLDGPKRVSAKLNADVRRWSPELGTIQVSATLRVPATLAAGMYRVALALPDASAALATKSEYAVQLANSGVWNGSAGDNTLYSGLVVDANAGGCVDSSATQFTQLSP